MPERRVTRVEAADKVTGRARYTADLHLPGMLYGRFVRSPHAHARITQVDLRPALAVPGVVAVIGAGDVPEVKFYGGKSALFEATARYEGDEIAAVAAETAEAARRAAEAVRVEYEPLPFTSALDGALAPDAPRLHDGELFWTPSWATRERGDVARGFKDAAITHEATYRTGTEVHACMETHGSVVSWERDLVTVWVSTQSVHETRAAMAERMGIPLNRLRVICEHMGGGFGSKLELGKDTVAAALLSKATGRPVRMMLDRYEDFVATGNRCESKQSYRAGLTKDGRLTAITLDGFAASGAYPANDSLIGPAWHYYVCPNVRAQSQMAYVNAGRARATRGVGMVMGTAGFEGFVDELAARCGLDPIEFRLRNHAEQGASGKQYSVKHLRECYERGAAAIGWARRRGGGITEGHLRRGFGMNTVMWWGNGWPPCHAEVQINTDGTAQVSCGVQDIGTGTRTVIALVASETLGIAPEAVRVIIGDTEKTPYGPGSHGSGTLAGAGPAVRQAAEAALAQVLAAAAKSLETKPADLERRNGSFVHQDGRSVSWADACSALPGVAVGTGAVLATNEEVEVAQFGAHFAEVLVDTETGLIEVQKVVAVHDFGRVLNPMAARNQIYGGVIQAIGWALREERLMDRTTGRVLNARLGDYKVMTAGDVFPIEVIMLDIPDMQANTLGAKGLGEPPRIGAAAAMLNAVSNALGRRVQFLPMTPDRILALLEVPK